MGTYVAATYPRGYDFPISTLFWGAVIVIALFVSCLLAWKAIEWVRNRRKSDGVVVEVHLKDRGPWDPGRTRFQDRRQTITVSGYYGDELGGWEHDPARAGGTLLDLCPRKVRKAMKQRRKAREQAQKKQNK